MSQRVIDFPAPFEELFEPHRYKVYYGGRGSGKSMNFARALLLMGASRPLTVLCTREVQTTIADSVHRLLREQLEEIGMGSFYRVTQNAIYGKNGTEFIFKGLRFNVREIKSTEGVDICWVEEGQAVSADSWDVLIPTIRKEGSEIWISFNPLDESDPTFQRFVISPPSAAYIRKVNYNENPFFPEVLRKEMEWLKSRDYQAYLHIWEGEVKRHSNALVFGNYFNVEEFETPARVRFYHGADWGFACLGGDTLIMTDKGEIPIRDIRPGDKVLTRRGYRRVVAFLPRGRKKVYTVDCGNDRPITATTDHRFYTADGWKRVDELKAVENVCMIQSNLTAGYTSDIQTGNTRTTSIASGRRTANIISESITETCGNTTTETSPKVATFITSMGIRLTTALKTLCALLKASTKRYITPRTWAAYPKKLCKNIDGFTATIKKTGQSVGLNLWKRRRDAEESAKSVESLTPSRTYIKNSAPHNAGRKAMPGTRSENMYAKFADELSSNRLTQDIRLAQMSVPINLQSLSEWQDVYDLSIEGEHEFFANGVLVHNCDPTTLIRCFIDGKRLYIDREAWGIGVEIDNTPALFDTIDTARKWPIKADCARPETISYMRRQGFKVSAAKKWSGSIEDGIEFLKTFEIVVHPRCKHTIDELNHYSYKIDKQTGDILPVIVDSWNHCLDALRYSLDGLIKGKTGDWSALIS